MPRPKHQFPRLHRDSLPADITLALATLRNDLKESMKEPAGKLSENKYKVFGNNRQRSDPTDPLPKPAQGCRYREVRVGQSREFNEQGEPKPGKRRLVVELNEKPRQLREIYFTNDHYQGFFLIIPSPS